MKAVNRLISKRISLNASSTKGRPRRSTSSSRSRIRIRDNEEASFRKVARPRHADTFARSQSDRVDGIVASHSSTALSARDRNTCREERPTREKPQTNSRANNLPVVSALRRSASLSFSFSQRHARVIVPWRRGSHCSHALTLHGNSRIVHDEYLLRKLYDPPRRDHTTGRTRQ